MAIWQYQLHIIPNDEIDSFFGDSNFISQGAFDEINWWKYKQLKTDDFSIFSTILKVGKSWSKDIILFGHESSNCVEIFFDDGKIYEVSVRIDIRQDYRSVLLAVCDFAERHNCVLVNTSMRILQPVFDFVKRDIDEDKLYLDFINMLRG